MSLSWIPLIATVLCTVECKSGEYPPLIETYPQNQNVARRGIAVFTCTAAGNPKPHIEWRKNGKRINTQLRYDVLDMPNGSVLRIEPTNARRDGATYKCVADNGVGVPVSASASLNVLPENSLPEGFPKFIRQPYMKGIQQGSTAILPCQVEGEPEPTVKWLKNKIPLDMSISRYSLVDGSSLQITDPETEDQGAYECMAENSHGTAVSVMATLYVRVRRLPPYFSIRPENLYEVMPGSGLNITCVAVGSPVPVVKWIKGLQDMAPDDALPIGKNVLVLTDINESANYTCIAVSILGSIDATTQVVVQAPPRPPSKVRISMSVSLSWSYDIGSEDIIYYVIRYKPKQSNQEYSEISNITTRFYTVHDLSPYTEYEFYVIAVNGIGRSLPSAPVLATTGVTGFQPGFQLGFQPGFQPGFKEKPGDPPYVIAVNSTGQGSSSTPEMITSGATGGAPRSSKLTVETSEAVPAPSSIQAAATSYQSVEVWWDPLPPSFDIIGYEVLCVQPHLEDLDKWKSKSVPITYSAEISGLHAHETYAIFVAARTRQGLGQLSEHIWVKVNPTDVPTELKAQDVTTHSMYLSWRKPLELEPIRYKISYGAYKEFYDNTENLQKIHIPTVTVIVRPDITEYYVNDLMPFTSYHVNITAIPEDEVFRPPAKIIVTTAMAAPNPMVRPDSFGVRNGQGITVFLPKASEEYGPIGQYLLVVVPNKEASMDSEDFTIDQLSATPTDKLGPYIAASFQRHGIPEIFSLGDGKMYNGYLNRRLQHDQKYSIFVRAIVNSPQQDLYTDSPVKDLEF